MTVVNKRYAHINHASGSAHNLLDAEAAYVTGSLYVGQAATLNNTLTVANEATFSDKAVVTLDITGSANLDIARQAHIVGDTQLDAKLFVGTATGDFNNFLSDLVTHGDLAALPQSLFSGDTAVGGNFIASGSMMVLSNSAIMGDLNVKGVAEFKKAVTMLDTLTAGNSTLANVYAKDSRSDIGTDVLPFHAVYAQELHAQTLSASQHLYSQGDLKVQDAATFQSSITVGGAANLNDSLEVTGSATVKTDLTVNKNLTAANKFYVVDGGDVSVKGADLYVKNSSGTEKFKVAAASGDTKIWGTLTGEDQATLKGAGYGLVVNNSASFGAVRVYGDLVVDGDQVILNTSVLQVEDYNITLVSGSHGDDIASGAGLTIQGDDAHTFTWKHNEANEIDATTHDGANAFVINDNWLPSTDDKFFLGKPSHAWKGLYLSGDAHVGGDLAMDNAGAITGIGSLTAQNVTATTQLSGAALSVGGNASVQGTLGVTGQTTLAGLGAGASTLASLGVTGASTFSDVATFSAAVTASAGLSASQIQAQGVQAQSLKALSSLSASAADIGGALNVAGLATFSGQASFASSATVQAPYFFTIAQGATLDVQGSAQYVNLSATGNGTFGGSLTVGGINISPISSSSPVTTSNGSSTTMLSEALVDGDMAKFEIEVIARSETENCAASWKISVAALHDGTEVQAMATELSKEPFGALGPNLDVVIDVTGASIAVIAKGAAGAQKVYWDCQIVKKMVMSAIDGSRKY